MSDTEIDISLSMLPDLPLADHLIPTLRSSRIVLTPFTFEDAPLVVKYAGDFEVARTTQNIPHPYPADGAEKWIASHQIQFLEQQNVVFAIRLHSGDLVGAINLVLDLPNSKGELGYWIGRAFWGQGFCTDAARAVIRYGFTVLDLNKIYARHMSSNLASGRVMQKSGMIQEGYQRQHLIKDGKFIDVVEYGIIREDYKEVNPLPNSSGRCSRA